MWISKQGNSRRYLKKENEQLKFLHCKRIAHINNYYLLGLFFFVVKLLASIVIWEINEIVQK